MPDNLSWNSKQNKSVFISASCHFVSSQSQLFFDGGKNEKTLQLWISKIYQGVSNFCSLAEEQQKKTKKCYSGELKLFIKINDLIGQFWYPNLI